MSRIGKKPIVVPDKVEVKIADQMMSVKGPNGLLEFTLPNLMKVEKVEKTLVVTPKNKERKTRALWGMARTMINNMIMGVTQGFKTVLEFEGVGYRAAVQGDTLTLNLGFSHPIEYKLPKGIKAAVVKNTIEFTGADKELLGRTAAKVRAFRPPEPYKGKGLKYLEEKIIRKAGKSGAKK